MALIIVGMEVMKTITHSAELELNLATPSLNTLVRIRNVLKEHKLVTSQTTAEINQMSLDAITQAHALNSHVVDVNNTAQI